MNIASQHLAATRTALQVLHNNIRLHALRKCCAVLLHSQV